MSKHTELIVGLDIGTTKICCMVARVNQYQKLEILGFGKAESFGVKRGVVENIDKTVDSIKLAVADAERTSGVNIRKVYVGIAGQHIRSMQQQGILTRSTGMDEVREDEVQQLIEEMHLTALNPGERIIHVIPQEFMVDGQSDIKDPVGMCGSRLMGNFHIITGQISAAQNIERCVRKAGLEMAGLILEPLASSSAVLSAEEKEAGVALVDIGGGTTDVAIFVDEIIRHTAVIPMGGDIVTNDIKEGCKIMKKQAEAIKTKFGSALADETQDNEVISVPGLSGRDPKEISVKNLAKIIQARVEEIVEQINFEIKHSGYSNKLIGGVVITGGGSQLKHLKQLVEYMTGLETRIGFPVEHLSKGYAKEVTSPVYSTCIGLLLRGFDVNKRLNGHEPMVQMKAVDEPVKTEVPAAETKDAAGNVTDDNKNEAASETSDRP